MTPAQCRAALVTLGWSQCEAARQLGYTDRRVRQWLVSGPPAHVAVALGHLVRREWRVPFARAYCATFSRRPAATE